MDLTEYYYEVIFGMYPFKTNKEKIKTSKTIEYLKDNGYNDKQIIDIINHYEKHPSLEYIYLDETLWKDSLIKKNNYYFHNELQLRSKPPVMNPKTFKFTSEPFYVEMKINYTINDLLDYFYKKANIAEFIKDEKKDIGALQYLLNQYNKIDFIDSLDFILYLIDYATSDSDCSMTSLFQLDTKYRAEVYEYLKPKITQAKAQGLNKIIFR